MSHYPASIRWQRHDAPGVLARNAERQMVMTMITLRPVVHFCGSRRPDNTEVQRLHHEARAACFLAKSVKTEVRCEPVFDA